MGGQAQDTSLSSGGVGGGQLPGGVVAPHEMLTAGRSLSKRIGGGGDNLGPHFKMVGVRLAFSEIWNHKKNLEIRAQIFVK